MSRIEFTRAMTTILDEMIRAGEFPIVDYVKRSTEEQKRMFDAHLSKCDGEIKKSKHQTGMAVDIYFLMDGVLKDPIKGWEFWHEEWMRLGGKPYLEWDKGHFEF